jgi:hypothetical protein
MSFLTLEFIPSHNRSLFVVPIKHFVPLEGRGVSTVRAFDSFLLVNFVPHDNTYDTLQIVNLATSNYFPGFAVLSVTTLATLPASHSRSCRVSGESMAWKKTIVTFVITNRSVVLVSPRSPGKRGNCDRKLGSSQISWF